MTALSGIATDVEVSIHEIQTLLDEEDKQEKEFQVTIFQLSTIVYPAYVFYVSTVFVMVYTAEIMPSLGYRTCQQSGEGGYLFLVASVKMYRSEIGVSQ